MRKALIINETILNVLYLDPSPMLKTLIINETILNVYLDPSPMLMIEIK